MLLKFALPLLLVSISSFAQTISPQLVSQTLTELSGRSSQVVQNLILTPGLPSKYGIHQADSSTTFGALVDEILILILQTPHGSEICKHLASPKELQAVVGVNEKNLDRAMRACRANLGTLVADRRNAKLFSFNRKWIALVTDENTGVISSWTNLHNVSVLVLPRHLLSPQKSSLFLAKLFQYISHELYVFMDSKFALDFIGWSYLLKSSPTMRLSRPLCEVVKAIGDAELSLALQASRAMQFESSVIDEIRQKIPLARPADALIFDLAANCMERLYLMRLYLRPLVQLNDNLVNNRYLVHQDCPGDVTISQKPFAVVQATQIFQNGRTQELCEFLTQPKLGRERTSFGPRPKITGGF